MPTPHRITLAALLGLFFPNPAATQSPAQGAAVDSIFAAFTAPGVPGCAVGVSQNDSIVLARAYGMADLERAVPLTPGSIFEAGSVSKQFTAAAVLLLAQDGKLSLDDDIRKYFPELPDYGDVVTIRHLLNHTSGLRDWGAVAAVGGWPRGTRFYTNGDALRITARQRALNYRPGSEYLYSNTNYNLLALLVERVSGQSFAAFTKSRLFDPLSMTSTSWRDDYARVVKGRALAYSPAGSGFRLNMFFENAHGNGGLLTTVEDLLRWNANFANPRVGAPAFVAEQHRQGRLRNGSTIRYAAGLFVDRYRGLREVSHDGSTGGYNTLLTRFPEQGVSVAVLCNLSGRNPSALARRVADLFLPPAPVAEASTSTPSAERRGPSPEPERLAGYAGLYRNTRSSEAALIELKDGKLIADTRFELVALSPTAFQVRGAANRLLFGNGTGSGRAGFQLVVPAPDTIAFEPVEGPDSSAAALAAFVGTYRSDEADGTHRIVLEGSTLILDDGAHTRAALRPYYRDAFRGQNTIVRFSRNGSGRVTGYGVWLQRARDVRFTRVSD